MQGEKNEKNVGTSPCSIRTTRDKPIAVATTWTQPNPARVLPAATRGAATAVRCPSRAVRSPPASAPLRARLGPAPPHARGPVPRPPRPLRLCIAPRLAPAGCALASRPARSGRLRRPPLAAGACFGLRRLSLAPRAYTASASGRPDVGQPSRGAGRPLAAARTPLRQSGCCAVSLVRCRQCRHPARRRASRREARARVRRGRCRGRLRQPRRARSGSAGPGRGRALSGRQPSARRPPRRPKRARRRRRAPRASRARPRATRPDRRRGPSPSG